jgi:hypothetical protein
VAEAAELPAVGAAELPELPELAEAGPSRGPATAVAELPAEGLSVPQAAEAAGSGPAGRGGRPRASGPCCGRLSA